MKTFWSFGSSQLRQLSSTSTSSSSSALSNSLNIDQSTLYALAVVGICLVIVAVMYYLAETLDYVWSKKTFRDDTSVKSFLMISPNDSEYIDIDKQGDFSASVLVTDDVESHDASTESTGLLQYHSTGNGSARGGDGSGGASAPKFSSAASFSSAAPYIPSTPVHTTATAARPTSSSTSSSTSSASSSSGSARATTPTSLPSSSSSSSSSSSRPAPPLTAPGASTSTRTPLSSSSSNQTGGAITSGSGSSSSSSAVASNGSLAARVTSPTTHLPIIRFKHEDLAGSPTHDASLLDTFSKLLSVGLVVSLHTTKGPRPVRFTLSGDELRWEAATSPSKRDGGGSGSSSSSGGALSTAAAAKRYKLKLTDISDVTVGRTVASISSSSGNGGVINPDLCFSLITLKTSLDLEASSQLERDSLARGFILNLRRLGKQV